MKKQQLNPSEDDLQIGLIELLSWLKPSCIFLHPTNQGKRSARTAALFKAMGMVPGAGDLIFLWGTGSAVIEMKSAKGKQTPEQKEFQVWCEQHGVPYVICRSIESAIERLITWGRLPETARRYCHG